MSTYGELIQALATIKNVKEKRLAIKSLAHMCSNRAFQVRIVQRGGWRGAILPLIVSLDEDCRKYAALAIANLSACTAAHKQLMEEQVLKQLAPVLSSEEAPEVLVYVLTSIGNFACSKMMWPDMRQLEVIQKIVDTAKTSQTEEILMHALFCIQNLTQDPVQRAWMLEANLYELVWGYMKHPNYKIMQYALSILRGLSVETVAQEKLAYMGLVPMLIGIYMETAEEGLKSVALDIFLHLSFVPSNAKLLLQPNIVACIQSAAESEDLNTMQIGVAIVANLCESVDFHDQVIESSLFKVLTDNVDNDITVIQQHVIRAMMQLSRSPRFHHVILATGVAANACPIAMTEKLSSAMRINALQMLGALCATHPTTPVESDVMDLAFLICNPREDIAIRRASMLVLANASSDKINKDNLLKTYLIDELVKVLSESYDVILTDYLTQFFHNMSKMDPAAGPIVSRSGFANHMFTFERLESLSITSAIYLCDTCRHLSENPDVRAELMAGQLFTNILDTWLNYVKDARVSPHLALMCSAFTYHSDAHQEFVLQGGVKLVIDIYERSQVEHVRLCCVLSMLYLAENEEARRSIFRERGLQMLVTACENETHIDLITNALKALIPYASADDYRPQMGMEGAMDTFASFMFSDQLQLQQLGVYLLQQLLEYKMNRRIFLGLASERKCDEEYLEALVNFLPRMMDSRKINKMTRSSSKEKSARTSPARGQMSLTPHDPFIVRSVILSLELLSREHESGPEALFHKYQVPKLLFDLFTSEQIDKSSGEAVLLTFANLLHGQQELQDFLLRKLDVLPMLLSCKELNFKRETNARCLSAMLAVSRVKDFRPKVMGQLENLMTNVSGNMNETERDDVFFATAALQCAILSELARASVDFHERMAKAGCVEALLVFITVGRSGGDNAKPSDIYVELMMSSVFGLTALVSSPIAGEHCMQNLVYPAARFQLFMSLLRKPEQEEIGAAFHVGTAGLRALQRVMEPAIVAEELQVDCLDAASFIARCEVPPAHFLYRNVLRALCLLLAHPDIGRRVLEALSVQNVLPTCLLALQGTTDVYVSVFGYLLAAKFSSEPSLLHGFVCNVPIMTELLSRCRRHIQGDGEADDRSPSVSRTRTGGTGPWAEKIVERNKYLLAMTALTNLGENAKEKYKPRPDDNDPMLKTKSISVILKGAEERLEAEDMEFLRNLAATSFRDVDAEAMHNPTMLGAVNGFVTLLRLVLVNNCMIMRIVLEKGVKGGEVQVERIDAAVRHQSKISIKNPELVPVDLRSEFRNLVALRRKTEALLHAVAACVEAKVATKLASTVVECLGGIAYFSPLSIAKPFDMFVLIKRCPEWLMPSLSCLFANMLADKARAKEGEEEDDFDPMSAEDSECLFPLISKSLLETREHMIGALSNLSIQKDKFHFVQRSGIFDMYEPLKTRGYFLENFAWMLQMCRLLTNLFSYIGSHKDELLHLVTPKLVGFLSGVLHITADLVCNGELNAKAVQRPSYEYYSATFDEDDVPPLGLKIWWSVPPRLSEMLPDTPAAALGVDFQPGDELMEVNGVDVSSMEKEDILPMFEDRPLDLYFRRTLQNLSTGGPEWATSAAQGEVETIEKLECYGDRPQYIECFNLVLLTVHNLATQGENLPNLLADPQLLGDLLEILPHKALSPTLRRLLFSTVTCMARDKDVAGIVFGAMKTYFESCDKADPSLHKYVLLSSNLFYTAMKRDEVQPNRQLVAFVGRICALESATTANMALVEILHGMSQAPEEQVLDFSSRDTMVSALKFMENDSQWDCQARAFESIFFLTKRACQPHVWLSTDLLPRMVKAAAHLERMGESAAELQNRADAAWEMTLRTFQVCLSYPELINQLQQPDLDHAMMESFSNPAKPIVLAKLSAEFMAGLFKTPIIGSCWHSWRSAGFFEKLLGWCKRQRRKLAGEEEEVHYQVGSEVSLGECMDSVFHMLIFALEAEPSFVGTLSAADVTQCIALQILSHSKVYRRLFALKTQSDEADLVMEHTHAAFRIIAQLMTALLASEKGLTAMTGMNLEAPLVKLLELPRSDHHNSALVVLCALSGRKEISAALLNNESFFKLLLQWEEALKKGDSTMPLLEHEYYTSLVDRMCCHPELSREVGQKLFVLVSRLAVRAPTALCRVMGARVAAQCGLEVPEILGRLPLEGPTCLHYVLAATSCLRVQSDDTDGSTQPRRRSIAADVAAMTKDHPHEARMASHYARAVLCEAVSVSRNVCQYSYAELDCTALLRAATVAYGDLVANAAAAEHLDLVASEALNHLVGMMHILLCVVFRQGLPGEPYRDPEAKAARSNVSSTVNALDALFGCLQLDRDPSEGNPSADTGVFIASRLSGDIRVQFWLSALLREVCAKPLRSCFLGVVRTRIFLKALEASIRLALKRLEYEVHGPAPKDLFAKRQVKGMRDSPLVPALEELSLALVFEHLIVALRHTLVQAMYVEGKDTEDPSDPWRWKAQEFADLHQTSLSWLPEVVKRFGSVASIKTEAVRYICAISSFYEAPRGVGTGQNPSGPTARDLLRTFSLVKPEVLELLILELEATQESCTLCLACMAIANLTEHLCVHRKQTVLQASLPELPLEDICRLARAVVRALKEVPKMSEGPQLPGVEVAVVCMTHSIRAISCFLALNQVKLTVEIMVNSTLEAVQTVFELYFRDDRTIRSEEDYAAALKQLVVFMRNWAVAGCTADQSYEKRAARDLYTIPQSEVQKEERELAALAVATDVPAIMNFLVRVAAKLWEGGTRNFPNKEAFCDDLFSDVLLTLRTLLKRSSDRGSITWGDLQQRNFERLLEAVKEHRFRQTGQFEDEELMGAVYLLTFQGFPYISTVFPKYMMQIAYGPREEHTPLQDVAAVCCAIQSTRAGKGKASQAGAKGIEASSVIKDYADFVHGIAKLKAPRMQVWHYRLLAGECQKESVLAEVAADARALQFVVDRLCDEILGRYSVAIVHNMSVQRCAALVSSGKYIVAMCQSYRSFGKDGLSKDPSESRLLRRLLVASMRNCLLGTDDLQNGVSDTDIAAIVGLVPDLERPDYQLYMAMLLTLSRRCPKRALAAFAAEPQVMEFLARCMLEKATACMPTNFHQTDNSAGSDLYVMQLEEDVAQQLEEEEEARRLAEEEALAAASVTTQALLGTTRRTEPPTAHERGLGKRANLWQTRNRERLEKATGAPISPTAVSAAAKKTPKGEMIDRPVKQRSGNKRRGNEHEYIYFAAEEILTSVTFVQATTREIGPEHQAVLQAVDSAFKRHTISEWLQTLKEQVSLYEKRRISLTDLYVQCSAKFVWHCWMNPVLKAHIDTPENLEAVAAVAPLFLGWSSAGVRRLFSEVALVARLHRHPIVTEYLVANTAAYPELCSSLLANALAEPDRRVRLAEARSFVSAFVELLKARSLSRTGLRRLLLGLEHAVLADHPEGLCQNLVERAELLMELIEALRAYSESPVVKHCIAVMLAQTMGRHYQPINELDEFVLLILDLAGPLLESEFAIFMPVVHGLIEKGGPRVIVPLLQRQLHMRVARLLEEAIDILENPGLATEPAERKVPSISEHQTVQWNLALLTLLAGCHEGETLAGGQNGEILRDHNPLFEAFVCVDLLPVLVRVLRQSPGAYETLAACFLISSVAKSSCIVPYMPDIVRLAEQSILPRLRVAGTGKMSRRRQSVENQGRWEPIVLPVGERMLLGINRSFIHLISCAGYQPHNRPALLNSKAVFEFVAGLQCDVDLFADPAGPLHAKLHNLAHLCACRDNHTKLLELGVLDALREAQLQMAEAAEMLEEFAEEPHDLRLHWLHCIVSLLRHEPTGVRMVSDPSSLDLILSALRYAEEMSLERRHMKRRRGLDLVYTSQAALAAALARLSAREDFVQVYPHFTLFLLGLVCSGPLVNLRIAACDHLQELLARGCQPIMPGAVLIKTPCADSFKRTICGTHDGLVTACAQVMITLCQTCGYSTHIHLASRNAEAALAVIADSGLGGQPRITSLAELVLAFSMRTHEVLDVMVDVPDLTPFLRLARSNSASRRQVVQAWLEMFGSSMYEIEETIRVFGGSTMSGFLHLAANCTLEPEKSQDLRRCMFAVVHGRVDNWRRTPFGITQFMEEDLIKAMIPMCELQPDLVAGVVAMFHSFITHNETQVLNRVWKGGHFGWLCKRMTHKSKAQAELVEGRRGRGPVLPAAAPWADHKDLLAVQGMSQRLVWILYDMNSLDAAVKVVDNGWIVKNWQTYVSYYCHHPWPQRDNKELEEAMDSTLILAMKFVERLTFETAREKQLDLIKQGILRLCSTVLLPRPEDQRAMFEAVDAQGPTGDRADNYPPEADVLQKQKMIAGSITVRLMQLEETYQFYKEPHAADLTVAMLAQLHHWRAAIFYQQGSVSVLTTVGLLERSAALYSALVSGLSIDWHLNHLGLRNLEVFCSFLLELWCRHPNSVLKHHALRLVSLFFQLHVLFISVLIHEDKAAMLSEAVHRILGIWDVRELRQVTRLMVAALSHALGIPVMPERVSKVVANSLLQPDVGSLREVLKQGGALRANQSANRHLLLPRFMNSLVEWCEHPGDLYGRSWCLWLVLTLLVYGEPGRKATAPAQAVAGQEVGVLIFGKEVEEKHILRRARLEAEQQSVALHDGKEAPLVSIIMTGDKKDKGLNCRGDWLCGSPRLGAVLARMASKCLASGWKTAEMASCAAAGRCLVEHPHFLCNAAEILDGAILVRFLMEDDRTLALASLTLVSLIASYRLPLKAQNVASNFLTSFYNLQESVIEGFSRCGEGPYDQAARWLNQVPEETPLREEYRSLVTFMVGQAVLPPLAVPPSLDVGEGTAEGPDGAPAVANCDPPPVGLMDKLGQDVLKEDQQLKDAQVAGVGPTFSSMLCHLLYALAVIVPFFPKAAAESPYVRGAAFSQLFKIQQIVSLKLQPKDLFDPMDKDQCKLFLYIRAMACIKLALRVITGSWFAPDIGVRFVVSEQGGRDFMQYCTRHIIQVYNGKTAVTRVLGTPWERVMLSQGPTETIAELLLMVCSSDANLVELERLGGDRALHGLAQFAEKFTIRQQAAMLLSKLAVMTKT